MSINLHYIINQVVYVARNPKDVIVSYFHYHKLLRFQKFEGDLESFANYFMSDKGTPVKETFN